MTKREVLNYIKDELIPTIADAEVAIEVANFVTKELAALDKKAAAAKTYAAKKRDELDDMCNDILKVMTTDLVPIDLIVAAIDNEDATKAKIQARLSKMHKSGLLNKDSINIAPEGSKKHIVVAYGLATNDSEEVL